MHIPSTYVLDHVCIYRYVHTQVYSLTSPCLSTCNAYLFYYVQQLVHNYKHTTAHFVDGKNPAPPWMVETSYK